MTLIKDRRTDTTIFLMPVLGINRDDIKKHKLIDAFLDDISREVHYDNSIYLLFKPENMELFQDFLITEQERYPEIVDDYDYPEGYVVIVYKFPEIFINDYNLILNGEYSKTSHEFKMKFGQVIKIVNDAGYHQDVPSLQWMIFKKSPDLKEQWELQLGQLLPEGSEVWGKPDLERETLDIHKIIENQVKT